MIVSVQGYTFHVRNTLKLRRVCADIAGGYAVLKGIQKGMSLPDEAVIPSFASLRDMGNTSSSTTWYTIAYLESQDMIRKGQQIMQVSSLADRPVAQHRSK